LGLACYVSHIGLSVVDIDRSTDFYRGAFGFVRAEAVAHEMSPSPAEKLLGVSPLDFRVAFLSLEGLVLQLLEFSIPTPVLQERLKPVFHQGLVHLCFKVADVDVVASAIERLGGMVRHDTRIKDQDMGRRVDNVMCCDPDGTRIELSGLV
jgi:catechol 2,3-dioxygenase-like lactoylglutathione lyase family enzyme